MGPRPEALRIRRDHRDRGDVRSRRLFVAPEQQRGFQRSQRQLPDSHRAQQRVLSDPPDELGTPDDDPCLGPTQELVAAESDDVGAGLERSFKVGLGAEPERGGLSKQAGAEIVNNGETRWLRDLRQSLDADLADETGLAEVRAVHFEEHPGLGPDRFLVVSNVRAIGGAHLNEPGPALGDDRGHPERTPDLHQLPTGDDDLVPLGELVQHQDHGRGVVIHDQGVAGAAQLSEQPRTVVVARPTRAALEIVFQIRVPVGDFRERRPGGRRQRRPPQIRVQRYTRGVDHAAERALIHRPQLTVRPRGDLRFVGRRRAVTGRQLPPQILQRSSKGTGHERARALRQKPAKGGRAQERIDARDSPPRIVHGYPEP